MAGLIGHNRRSSLRNCHIWGYVVMDIAVVLLWIRGRGSCQPYIMLSLTATPYMPAFPPFAPHMSLSHCYYEP